jgi:signal transduction histidine kinase
LTGTAHELQLAIRDDGAGFGADSDEHLHSGHYGLIGMRERASQIGGVLELESQPGQGTTVWLKLSLNGATGAVPSAGAVTGESSHPNAS